jgi:serine protease Do
VPGGTSAAFFHQETGELLENKLVITSSGLGEDKVERLYFSPEGKHLLFVCSGSSGRYLRAVGLRLSTREAAIKRREPVVPKAEAKPIVVPVAELHGLYPPPEPPNELSPKEIGKRFLYAVVSIVTDRGSGSGFFIGKSGYLLTSAHVVEDAEKINVIHNRDVGQQFVAMESTGRVIRSDPALDVALLKVSCSRELPYVILAREPTVDTGESVIVIGSPGLGEAILNRTMTSGIVSNPDRLIDDQHYIQTSAPINAGNSGGAMFDSRGQVIGLINLKAQIDGAGFATPARALREFLREATRNK